MTKQELQPDQKKEQKNVQPPQSELEELIRKGPTLAEEILEAYRKLEKARDILHTASNIGVGETPNEVLVEKRALTSILLTGKHLLLQTSTFHLTTMSIATLMTVLLLYSKRIR
jgi:hypothetical protein